MIKLHSGKYANVRRHIRNCVATVLFVVIGLLTVAGGTGPVRAQTNPARVGILSFSEAADDPNLRAFLKIFRRELFSRRWIEGENLTLEFRSAHSDPSRFAEVATALVALECDVIVPTSAPALRAAYAATRAIPLIASDYTTDPVAEGYIESYATPGRNVTGVFLDAPAFAGEWFELLTATIPDLSRVAVLWDPGPGDNHLRAVRSIAELLGIKLQVLEVRTPADIDRAFTALLEQPQALVFMPSPMIYGHSEQLADLTLVHRLPGASMATKFAIAGGMIAYGPDTDLADERVADMVARVLSGNSPATIPVERPTKFKLIVNLGTAKLLGITIPESILIRADEVIR